MAHEILDLPRREAPLQLRQTRSTAQAANILGISKATLYRLVNARKLPRPLKIGDKSLWFDDELAEYQAQLVAARDAA